MTKKKNKINIIEKKEVEESDFHNVAQRQIEEYKRKHDGKEPEGEELEEIMKNAAKFNYKNSDGSWGELNGAPIFDGWIKTIKGFGGR